VKGERGARTAPSSNIMMGLCHLEPLLHANTSWVLGLVPAGGASMLEKLPLILGGAIIGGSIAWVLAKRQSLTQHRIQQELWDRKFRLAEADREAAVTSLNQNNIDVKRIKGTYEAHVQRITSLQAELTAERTHTEQLRGEIDGMEAAMAELGGAREASESAAADARAESDRKTRVHREISKERDTLQARVQGLEAELEKARAKLTDDTKAFRATIAERDGKVAEWQRRHAEDQEAMGATLAGLEERILELEPVPAQLEETRLELDEARAERARLVRDHAEEVERLNSASAEELDAVRLAEEEARDTAAAAADATRTELEERLAELAPLPEQLEAARLELELLRSERTALLESTTAEITELKGRISELVPLEEQLNASRAQAEKLRTELANLEAASATQESELRERIAELEPLPGELSAARSDLRNARERLAELEPLVPRLARVETELDVAGDRNDALRSETSEEIATLQSRVAELEPVVVELARREGELKILRERVETLEPLPAELRDREAELQELRERSAEDAENARLKERELEQRLKQLEGIEDEFLALRNDFGEFKTAANRDARAAELDGKRLATSLEELEARNAELESLRGRLSELQAAQKADQREAHQLRGQAGKLETRLTSTKLKLDEQVAQLREAKAELTKLRRVVARAEAREQAAAAKAARAAGGAAEPGKAAAGKGSTKKAPAKKAASKKAPASRKSGGSKENVKTIQPAPRRSADDLTTISGIGPSYEKVLKKAGIHRYEQLATLTAPKLQALAEKIDIPVDRMKKDRWVQKAKAAHQKKYKP